MRISALCVVAGLLMMAAPSFAQTGPVCSQVIAAYKEIIAKPATSRTVVRRLLMIISFTDDSRLPNDDVRLGAIEGMKTKCQQIGGDANMSADEKDQIAKAWIAFIMTYRRDSGQSGGPRVLLASLRAGGSDLSPGWSPGEFLRLVTGADSVVSAPPPPPLRGAITLKVFPKKDFGQEQILRLRTLLPDFDIRQGRSTLVGTTFPADVLFVHRDDVSQQDVLKVVRVLQEVGVRIRSIQQRTRGPDQIQIGTIAPGGKPVFAGSQPLDIQELAGLTGDAFWKAAFNGQTWCDCGIGKTKACSFGTNGRPIPPKCPP